MSEGQVSEQVSEQFNEDPDDGINRLVFCHLKVCMLCKSTNDTLNALLFGDSLSGWFYCDECLKNQRITRAVYKHICISRQIPMFWLLKSKNKNLSFFRYSQRNTNQPIYIGEFSRDISMNVLTYYDDDLYRYRLPLEYKDSTTGAIIGRGISLQNLFSYNPWLYKEFTECEDLMDSSSEAPIKIGYKQLPLELKHMVEEAYELSKVNPMSFIY